MSKLPKRAQAFTGDRDAIHPVVEAAARIIEGSARAMGLSVVEG